MFHLNIHYCILFAIRKKAKSQNIVLFMLHPELILFIHCPSPLSDKNT